MISIDTPNGQGETFSGPARFGGWALDNNAVISNIAVSIDGVFVENALYGGNRPDVCTVLPNRPGCPYVGWNAIFDTTTIANGIHTLEITATAAKGQRATQKTSFTVANTTSNALLKMFIDQPSSQSRTVIGSIELAGWAIDDNGPISSVTISIDGVKKGNATYGVSRPDVCAAYPSRAGCPNVGWTLPLDTTLLANGTHTVAATAISANGDQMTIGSSFTVANWTSGNPMKIDIDTPGSNSSPFSGSAVFGGWAISDLASIVSVTVSVDGVPAGSGNYGVSRPDVCAAHPAAGCPNVGWDMALDTTSLANGPHTLGVTATSSSGQSSTVSSTFNVSNSGPILVDIDQPNPNSGIFTGTAALGGWTLDKTNGATITAVKILVDGVLNGMAYYGGNRPDVCAIYSSVSCPNVGWSYLLDTTALGNGKHSLDVTAISSTGRQATSSSSFTVTQ
jgi:N-acetylmuramoyl-L-alanine amidase